MLSKSTAYITLLFSILLIISGCSQAQLRYREINSYNVTVSPVKIYTKKSTNLSYPVVGQIKSAFVGEPIVILITKKQECTQYKNRYIFDDGYHPFIAIRNYKNIKKGIYPVSYIDRNTSKQYPRIVATHKCNNKTVTTSFVVFVDDNGNLSSKKIYSPIFDCYANYFDDTSLQIFKRYNNNEYIYFDERCNNIVNPINMRLIYTGTDGKTLHIKYQEFYKDMIRSAFSQDLIYNIAKNKKIRFRNIVIDVIHADNEKITYKINKIE